MIKKSTMSLLFFFSNPLHPPYHTSSHSPFEGKLSTVDLSTIQAYFHNITQHTHFPWKKSVINLNTIIKNNPILRYNWEHGIKNSTNLANRDGKEVLDLINAALHTPPAYSTNPLAGFPINVVLMDFMQNQNGRTFFSLETVNQAFKDILHQYALMVQSPLSLVYMNDKQPRGWFSPSAQKVIKYSEFQQYDPKLPHFGFKSWNQWFLRHFKPGQRPVGEGTPLGLNQNDVIVNSCESSPITLPIQPIFNVKSTDAFWLKDFKYSLSDMFGGEEKGYSRLFEGGTIYQAYLSAISYHHWHAPVSGKIVDIYSIPGTYYLDQSQTLGHYDPEPPADSQQFLSATAARMVIVIESNNPKIGTVGLIYIGMVEVSSCISSKNIGDYVQKGDHLGNFAFGGSSYVIVFQKKVKLSFRENMYDSVNGIKKGKLQNLSSYFAHVN